MNISDFIVFQSSQVLQIRLGFIANRKYKSTWCQVYRNTKSNQAKCFYSKQQTRREKPIQQKQKAGIVTSLNDTTLTKVTYGKYATRVPDEVAYGIYEWFSSQ